MTWAEKSNRLNDAGVSLSTLLDGAHPSSSLSTAPLDEIIRSILCPGFPGLLNAPSDIGARSMESYIKDIATTDLNRLANLRSEPAVIHDLLVYTEALGGHIYHYRDSNGHEVDAVITMPNGTWAAIEVKVGGGQVQRGAQSLASVIAQIDMPPPAFKAVITGTGFRATLPGRLFWVCLRSLSAMVWSAEVCPQSLSCGATIIMSSRYAGASKAKSSVRRLTPTPWKVILGSSEWCWWDSWGDPGRGRVQICHKGAPRRDRPRMKPRNINDSSRALRLDRGLCGRLGHTTRVGRAGKASAGRAAAAAGAPTTAVTTSTTPSGLRERRFGKDNALAEGDGPGAGEPPAEHALPAGSAPTTPR